MHDRIMQSPDMKQATRQSRADEAFDFIVERIFSQEVRPGDYLRIDALAAELEMSITPVREALNRLGAVGLARADANRGYRVAPLLDPGAFHRLFAARHAIELAAASGPPAGADWVKQLTPAELDTLDEIVTRMGALNDEDESYAAYSEYSRLDGMLHRELIRLSGNEFLLTAWQSLHFHLHVSRLYRGVGVIDFADAQGEHRALVNSLRDGDGDLFSFLCDKHIRRAEDRLVQLLPTHEDN